MAQHETTDFLSYLQQLVDERRSCSIRFRTVEGGISEMKAALVGLTSEGDRQILETDAGFSIGVDQLLQVNGRQPDNFC